MIAKIWAIASAHVGQPFLRSAIIEDSRGRPYSELRTIARLMNHNGEGMRYKVIEV